MLRAGLLLALLTPPGVAKAAQLRPGVTLEVLQQGNIPEPLDVEFSQDGHLWITCRRGEVFVIPRGTNDLRHVTTLPVDFSGERGLHGLAFHPDYPRVPVIYLYLSVERDEDHYNQLVRFKVLNPESATALSLVQDKVLLELPSDENGYHQGGAVKFNPADGKLYVTTGDNYRSPDTDSFYDKPDARPQNLGELRGKVLRLNLDGSVPTDNPFVGTEGARPEIYSYGHRNPYTMQVDPKDGRIFVGEVGYDLDASYEEINLITPGGNYGWPRCQGANTGTLGGTCPLAKAIDPLLTYRHFAGSCIVAGPVFRRGVSAGRLPSIFGDGIFYGDNSRSWIRFAKFAESGEPLTESFELTAELPSRPLAMTAGPDGDLYVLLYGGWFTPAENDTLIRVHVEPASGDEGADLETGATGEISLPAALESGVALRNTKTCAMSVKVEASGKWSYAPGAFSTTDGIEGTAAPKEFYVPGAPVGALIGTYDGSNYQLIGTSQKLVIPAGKELRLLINDGKGNLGSGGGFLDNEGAAKIKWTVTSCN